MAKIEALKSVSLENADSKVLVSNAASAISGWRLKEFSTALEKQEDKITLEGTTGYASQAEIRFSDDSLQGLVSSNWNSLERVDERTAVSQLVSPQMDITRKVALDPQGYSATMELQFLFKKEPPKYIFLDLFGSPKRENDKEGSIFGQAPDKVHITYRDLKSRHSIMAGSWSEMQESLSGVKWLGIDTRYFVMALVPEGEAKASTGAQVDRDAIRSPAIHGRLAFPTEGKKEFNLTSRLYFGPKELASLNAADPILADTIDFGWTSFLAVPLLKALKWLYSYVGNYGVAIIILTFIIKMLLFPLTYKSTKSMSKIAVLQPQMNALREKYKDDKEKLNQEMMQFMKTHGYNPVGGCLPILVQMPIFFALYRVLFNSMELYQAPFAGWIHDLSSPDPYFITPVLLAGLMFLQQKVTPTTTADPAQQKMLQFMPVIFGMFMLLLPAGLNIYMVVNSSVTIIQQWVLIHKMGMGPPRRA